MNYFPFHLGDYSAHTAHLEPMEDLAYRRLLDQYYLKEGPLPSDIQVTAKLVRMRSMVSDVESVLKEFFMLTDKGWMHDRCETEIAHMQDKQAKARASAAASVKSRQAFAAKKSQTSEASACESGNERSTDAGDKLTDVELPTPTPTPTPTPIVKEEGETRKRAATPIRPDDVDEQVWQDWVQLRKSKRATVSPTVVAEARIEAGKAGLTLERFLSVWCARGSQGLMADWLKPDERRAPAAQPESFAERDARNKREAWELMTGRQWPADELPGNVRPAIPLSIVIDENSTRRIA